MAKKPTKAQRKVLEAMRGGADIVWVSGNPPYIRYPQHDTQTIRRNTVSELLRAKLITQAGTLGRYWYEITDLGRSTLKDN